jgi:hypothetical protein
MQYIEKIKNTLCRELDEYAAKNKFTQGDIEMLYKLTDIVKNLDKIVMLEEGEGYSEARGRGRNARRDSMGRYSNDDSYEDYGEDGTSYGRGMNRSNRGYSRDDAKDHMMNKLGMMMEEADPKEREALKECMRAIERA